MWWPNGDQHTRYLSISSVKNQVAGEKATCTRLMPKDANVIEQVSQLLEPLSTFTDFLASETWDTVSHHACPKPYKPWCSGGKRCGIIPGQGNGKGDKNRHMNKAKSVMHMVCFNNLLQKKKKFFKWAWGYSNSSCVQEKKRWNLQNPMKNQNASSATQLQLPHQKGHQRRKAWVGCWEKLPQQGRKYSKCYHHRGYQERKYPVSVTQYGKKKKKSAKVMC